MKNSATLALQEVTRVEQRNKQKEKQMLKRMFKPQPSAEKSAENQDAAQSNGQAESPVTDEMNLEIYDVNDPKFQDTLKP